MKNYLISGGHSGIGLALSQKLLAEGHTVGIIVRSKTRKRDAELLFLDKNKPTIFVADLGNREAISALFATISKHWDKMDGLFNNAGVLLDRVYNSKYGNELHLEINAISPYLLSKALAPLLQKAKNPFVVYTAAPLLHTKKQLEVSEIKAPKKFTKFTGAYLDSKYVGVLLNNQLGKELPNIRFVSAHPGTIKTKLTASTGMPCLLSPVRKVFFSSPQKGAENIYKAAFDAKYQDSGIYLTGYFGSGTIKKMQYNISETEVKQLLA